MYSNERYQYLIDQYKLGKLSEAELQEISNLRLTDTKFQELYEAEVLLHESSRLNDLEDKMNELKGLEEDIKGEEDIDLIYRAARLNVLSERKTDLEDAEEELMKSRSASFTRRRWLSIAASLLILITAVWWVNQPTAKGPSEEYRRFFEEDFHTLIKHPTMRSSDWVDPLTQEQRYAYQLFQAQLFEEAIPELERLWEEKQDSLARYYLGWSYIGMGDTSRGKLLIE